MLRLPPLISAFSFAWMPSSRLWIVKSPEAMRSVPLVWMASSKASI